MNKHEENLLTYITLIPTLLSDMHPLPTGLHLPS